MPLENLQIRLHLSNQSLGECWGDIITDKDKEPDGWVEHYLELYSKENSITQDALDSLCNLPVKSELDTMPTLKS